MTLEYIEKTIWGKKYKDEFSEYDQTLKDDIENLYNRLLVDWKKFNLNPYWLVDELNKEFVIGD